MNGQFSLRAPLPQEQHVLHAWRNSERVRAMMKSDMLIAIETHRAWFEELASRSDRRVYMFEKQGVPIGVVQFADIDVSNRTCSWGFYLGEPDLPRGTGTMLGYMGLNEAFERLHLRKVNAEVLASNVPSYKMHKKLGFHIEGCLRKQIWRNDRYEDLILLSIFDDEWRKWRNQLDTAAGGGT